MTHANDITSKCDATLEMHSEPSQTTKMKRFAKNS